MDVFDTLDPALFGLWPAVPPGCAADWPPLGGKDGLPDPLAQAVLDLPLETKSAAAVVPTEDAAEQLRCLLNEMTTEMRAQFSTFRDMRRGADAMLADADETLGKLARADVKAATDAMSLIVRTLEKVDSLQRQLARDRDLAEDRAVEEDGYGAARDRLLKLIEARADERAHVLYQQWLREGASHHQGAADENGDPRAVGIAGGGDPDTGRGVGHGDAGPRV